MEKQDDHAVIDHINNALVGDMPSFGVSKESKFQQLMQTSQESNMANSKDGSLSVEAQLFTPTANGTQQSFNDALTGFENLSLSKPNPAAMEFVPRNMSAPNLGHLNSHMVNIHNIQDFIPGNHATNGMHYQMPHMGQNMQAMGDQDTALLDGGMQMSNSLVYTPPNHSTAMIFASGDNDSSINASSHASRKCRTSLEWIEERLFNLLSRKSQPKSKKGYIPATGPGTPYSHHVVPSSSTGSRSSTHTPDRSSPLLARRTANFHSHRTSPLHPLQTHSMTGEVEKSIKQENVGGTTYYITPNSSQRSGMSMMPVIPSYYTFPGSPPHVEYMKQKTTSPSFFMAEDLRKSLMNKHILTMMSVDTEQDPSVPAEVDNYHSLYPLEPIAEGPTPKSSTYGFPTSCYKAIKYKDGLPYCLRRIHGFRQVNQKCMVLVEMWKKLHHANIVSLREVFTSKAFGEHSLIFSHDYHAGAETLMTRHFSNSNNNFASKKWGGTGKNQGLLPENLIWRYIVQLTSALRGIHAAGLACRVMDPTKILVTDQSRIRINGVGVFDVLGYDNTHSNPRAHMPQYQQEDLVSLGKVILALSCNSVAAIQRENFPQSIELVLMNYSTDLKNLILYLLAPQQRDRNINDVMPMIGARFYTQLDTQLMRSDLLENELSKELGNGRLFRLLTKLCTINERPEVGMSSAWSETGDRYLLKLLRDHIFHQVTETGEPWVDLAHIVQCLNKLDTGVPEKVCLMSRDENNVLVVSYKDLKDAMAKCFTELITDMNNAH